MKHFRLAFIVVASLAIAGRVHADNNTSGASNQNAIEWLFSDIGNILKSATSALQDGTDEATENQANPAAPVATKIPPTETAQPAALPAAVEAPTPSVQTKTDNPFAQLFKSITALFKPSLEIDTTMSARQASPATPAKTDSRHTAPQTEPAAVIAAKPAPATEHKPGNPLVWLFSDLTSIFTPSLEIDQRRDETSTVAVAEPAPTPVAHQEPAPGKSANAAPVPQQKEDVPTVAPAHTGPIGWLISDIAKLFEASTVPTSPATAEPITIADAASRLEPAAMAETKSPAPISATTHKPSDVAVSTVGAPWVPASDTAIFNPNERLFDGAHLPPLAAAPVRVTASAATIAEAVPVSAPLRTLPPSQPEVRNYRKLGQHNKAVTPNPDDGLIANFVDAIIGESSKDESAEPLANKISDRIVAEEKLDLGHASPDADIREGSVERIGTGPLADIDLYLGEKTTIGAPYRAQDFDKHSCLEQPIHGTVFCLAQLGWPSEIAPSFDLDTAYTLPGEGILRFENGATSRVYAVFKASNFADVVKFMQHRFGPPMEREIVWMHMMEAPKMPNTTFRWTGITRDRKDTIVLEVRNFDDLRRSFADMNHGMVRLYRNGSRPIFKHLSTMDLMLMQRRRLADAPVAVETVAPQK